MIIIDKNGKLVIEGNDIIFDGVNYIKDKGYYNKEGLKLEETNVPLPNNWEGKQWQLIDGEWVEFIPEPSEIEKLNAKVDLLTALVLQSMGGN